MPYGGITFKHVLAFQIKIMMGNQYSTLINAMKTSNKDEIIVACLRLGWNDAFKHVSENISDEDIILECTKRKWHGLLKKRKTATPKVDDDEKNQIIIEICRSVLDEFKAYACQTRETSRHAYINSLLATSIFKNKFSVIKVIDPHVSNKYVCFGHIQKMFNMALKLYLCLKICAEETFRLGLDITLQYGQTPAEDVTLNHEMFDLLSSDNFSADCPIDHYILEAIDKEISQKGPAHTPIKPRSRTGIKKFGSIPWSKLNSTNDEDYIDIQKEITLLLDDPSKCNLCFDFEHWNS